MSFLLGSLIVSLPMGFALLNLTRQFENDELLG